MIAKSAAINVYKIILASETISLQHNILVRKVSSAKSKEEIIPFVEKYFYNVEELFLLYSKNIKTNFARDYISSALKDISKISDDNLGQAKEDAIFALRNLTSARRILSEFSGEIN